MKILLYFILALSTLTVQAKKSHKAPRPAVITQPPAYAIWDIDSEVPITEKNSFTVRPMASITKLMTVLVILQDGLDLEETITVTGTERSTRIRSGMRMSRHEIVELALISSDNLAARTLSETSGVPYSEFIAKMNNTAASLGMKDTRYEDSTGLLAANVSTPDDIRRLVRVTEQYSVYRQAANTRQATLQVLVKNKIKQITANNTNSFAGQLDIIGAKTGFTSPAGRCLTMYFNNNGKQYILVVLGATTPEQRRQMVKQLIDTVS